MVIYLERGVDLHTAQLMPLPLTVSCFSKVQIGFTFLVLAHPGSPGQRAIKRVCLMAFLMLPAQYLEKRLCNGRVSVCLSRRLTAAVACGWFAAEHGCRQQMSINSWYVAPALSRKCR